MTTKQKSTHALAAQAIRKELKKEFPLIQFFVRSRSFSMGNAVDVEWVNGPTSDQVNKIVGKYQYGHFNGMEDIYENTNSRNDIPQIKYVQIRRTIYKGIFGDAFRDGKSYFAAWENLIHVDEQYKANGYYSTPREEIQRRLSKQDLTNGYNKEMLYANN